MIHKTLLLLSLIGIALGSNAQNDNPRPQTPIMGWSSWNHFHIDINEQLIKEQADAMVSSGMNDAGYSFINIDDGYFGGRDGGGNLLSHPEKFPNGMKIVATYIHSKGLKAGIYSDAGDNTCASNSQRDNFGKGVGLSGHDEQDLNLMLKDWDYDFIKIDWCGGRGMGLNDQQRYTEIGKLIRSIRPDVVYNICRWQFPGKWALDVADSWRISGDILPTFKSVMRILDLSVDLWKYSSAGGFNDMDMLQVGRGMSYDEDKTHFTMWCMLNSPLLAGNDLRNMSKETIEILTNKEIIALNQDPLTYQAHKILDNGSTEIWAKPLGSLDGGTVAVVLLNRSGNAKTIELNLQEIGIDPNTSFTLRDLWKKEAIATDNLTFEVPKHGVLTLKIEGKAIGNVY
ncbi:MAG: glycoside hydrolase family 27 protein [Flavobacteriales bacterium]|nr:glycoside hydrolase family 27 protein [Flavobacteriales bacterium]